MTRSSPRIRSADRAWDWRRASPRLAFVLGAARGPRLFQLCLTGADFPLGMVALLESERRIADPAEPAVYVWCLTGARAAAMAEVGQPRLLTAAALDIAVTLPSLDPPWRRV